MSAAASAAAASAAAASAAAASAAVIAARNRGRHPNSPPATFPPPLQPHSIIKIPPFSYRPIYAASTSAAAARPETLKSRLADGETLYGIFLLAASPTVAEIAALAGYDFAVVDMEHGPGGISDALAMIRVLAAARTAAVVRVPEPSAWWAKKALDLGPDGIMFPAVESPAAAAAAVSYCRFPPAGVRGAAHPVVRASGYGVDAGYLEHYQSALLTMVQVETMDGLAQVEAIAAVDGVDCVQMGPLDLSASLGCLGDPGNRKVREALGAAERAVLAGGGAYLGGFAMPHDPPEKLRERGYHLVSGAVDVAMFLAAAVADVRRFKEAAAKESKEGEEKYWSE